MTTGRRRAISLILVIAVATVMAAPASGQSDSPEPSLVPLWEGVHPSQQLAFDPSGHLWAATADSTFDIYDRDGNLLETWGTFGRGDGQFDFETPSARKGGVAFRPDGSFYVADSDNARIQEFDANRAFVRSWGSFGTGDDQLMGPDSIALDSAGDVYVNETDDGPNDRRLHVFDPEGQQVRVIFEAGQGPFFALDSDGTVYIIDEDAMDLIRVRPDGTSEAVAELSGLTSFGSGILHLPDGGFLVAGEGLGGYGTVIQVGVDGEIAGAWLIGEGYMALDPSGDRFYTSSDMLRAYPLPASE